MLADPFRVLQIAPPFFGKCFAARLEESSNAKVVAAGIPATNPEMWVVEVSSGGRHFTTQRRAFLRENERMGQSHSLPANPPPIAIEESTVIAKRLQARDPRTIDELILRYQERLRRYLMRLTANQELAEDLLQETWMRVLAYGWQFNGTSQFSTWLFAIARNLVFDRQRRRSWTKSLEGITERGTEFELPSNEKTPFDYCAGTEHARLLGEALLTLQPRHREIVELRFHRDMSLGEIAQNTGASISSVKAMLYRALTVLRAQVKMTLSVQPEPLRLES
jgi:RNA polymerase sigma-70 factor (ECF subfamily)